MRADLPKLYIPKRTDRRCGPPSVGVDDHQIQNILNPNGFDNQQRPATTDTQFKYNHAAVKAYHQHQQSYTRALIAFHNTYSYTSMENTQKAPPQFSIPLPVCKSSGSQAFTGSSTGKSAGQDTPPARYADEIERCLARIERRLDGIEESLDSMRESLASMKESLARVEERLDMDEGFADVEDSGEESDNGMALG